MKLFLALLFITGSYLAFLFSTTNLVLGQAQRLNDTYQYVAGHADEIAAGRPTSAGTR